MTSTTEIAVVIVGVNSIGYVRGCLESLRKSDWRSRSHLIVYVDNGSSDQSAEIVRTEFPEVIVLANPRNVGFCRACNQGVNAVESRYVYLLNNDTLLFPDSIWPLVEFLDRRPSAAAACNRLLNPDLTDQWSARRFPRSFNALIGRRTLFGRLFSRSNQMKHYLYKDQIAGGDPFAVDWIPGSCTLVLREAYLRAGGLPNDMHYWSDALLCARLARIGFEVCVVPSARLVHFEGKGAGDKTAPTRRRLIMDFHRGAHRFYCEHYALGRYHPARWLAAVALEIRAVLLIILDFARSIADRGKTAIP
jgi:N-acetylglucosaminyl-diphospho-decaprenol L-rhamnosyltransferase